MDDARTRLRVRCCAPSRNTPGRSQPAPFGPSSGARSDRRGRRSAPREDACALRKVMNRSGLEPALGGQRGQQAHWTVGITATPFVESSLFLANLRTGHELNVEGSRCEAGPFQLRPHRERFHLDRSWEAAPRCRDRLGQRQSFSDLQNQARIIAKVARVKRRNSGNWRNPEVASVRHSSSL